MITIRKSEKGDEAFIAEHAYRLAEFGPPEWRNQSEMTIADSDYIIKAIQGNDEEAAVYIAVDENETPCGFIHLTFPTDYYTRERVLHVCDIVVVGSAEGKGVGKLLLAQADKCALAKKIRWVTLNVFEGNRHAQAVYEKAGYKKEWIKYLKQLPSP